MNIKKTIITTLALSSLLLGLTACESMEDGSAGGESSATASTGIEAAKGEEAKVGKEYKKVVVNFIKSKQNSLLALGANSEANKAAASLEALEGVDAPTVDSLTRLQEENEIAGLDKSQKLSSAEAKVYFKKSVIFLSKAVAEETLLVKMVTDMAKNAQAKIAAASIMEKVKLVKEFKPIIDLVARLPEDLKITSSTLADYMSYAAQNGISTDNLSDSTEDELENN